MSLCGEIENIQYEIMNTKARLEGLEMRLKELQKDLAEDKTQNEHDYLRKAVYFLDGE